MVFPRNVGFGRCYLMSTRHEILSNIDRNEKPNRNSAAAPKEPKWNKSRESTDPISVFLLSLGSQQLFRPCSFRPFDFHSILKIENQNFTIVIFNVWFLKNWKSKIYNLNFQCLLLRKVKLNIILQYFENQKLKIENGQLVVLTFCFQFPLPKIQDIKNSNLTK